MEGSQKIDKNITYGKTNIRIIADFSLEILQARRQWSDFFKVLENSDFTIPSGHLKFWSTPKLMGLRRKMGTRGNDRTQMQKLGWTEEPEVMWICLLKSDYQ